MKLVSIIMLAVATTAGAQNATFTELFAGKQYPLTLRLQDLDESWRRINVSGGESVNAAAMYRAILTGSFSPSMYYTKGQTVAVGNETYLIAYRAQSKQLDNPQAMALAMRGGGAPPEPEKPTAQTQLCLALLNLRSTGSFNDIRAFSLDAELTGGDAGPATEDERRAKEAGEASLKNLRKLGTAVMTYERERKVLPLLTDAKTAQEELILYVSQKEVFLQPDTKKPFQANATLAGRKLSEFAKPERIAVFYESAAGSDSARSVLFLDGHAERVAEQQWKRIKQDSQLP
jgi:hypothetical protein